MKPMKVTIGYDGSGCADEAIADLQRAGLPKEAEAVVVAVADFWVLPSGEESVPSPLYPSKVIEEARATAAARLEMAKVYAASACTRLRAGFPEWQIAAKSVAGSPAWAIIREAERQDADLIVVGSHGYSSLGRWILGSVSQTVLTQAPCSVRIARGGRATPNRPVRVLVGIDGSCEAELAVQAVAARDWPAGTDIRLIMVVNPALLAAVKAVAGQEGLPEEDAPVASAIVTPHVDGAGRLTPLLDHYLAIAQRNSCGATASTLLIAGDPKRVLVDEANRWGADCIFVGSRGLTRWERLLLGSVSSAVATRANCPVEVIRARRPRS